MITVFQKHGEKVLSGHKAHIVLGSQSVVEGGGGGGGGGGRRGRYLELK